MNIDRAVKVWTDRQKDRREIYEISRKYDNGVLARPFVDFTREIDARDTLYTFFAI